MAGINMDKVSAAFEKAGDVWGEVMDKDFMDIGRKMEITNPDGSTGETDGNTPIYPNVPCHIEYKTPDNPDPTSIDSRPVVVMIEIHCNKDIDIQNGDKITARVMSYDGEALEEYKGEIGFPTVYGSRKSAIMSVRSNT